MTLTLRQLSPRQRDSLRVALASLLERYFAYPPYFDFRRNASAHRPVDGAKRLEIIRYVQQVSFDVDIQLDAPALERWAAQTLLIFANANPALATTRASSRRQSLIKHAQRAAADIAQHALNNAQRDPPVPFTPESARTWLGQADSRARPDFIAEHERQTQMIALVLARPRPPKQPVVEESLIASISERQEPSGFLGFGRRKAPAQHEAAQPQAAQSSPTRPREAPADLLQLYGAYLSDMQPEMTTHETAAIPRPSTFQGGSSGAMPGADDAQTDMQLFYQLRFQIEGYVRKAARSYGLPDLPGDPAHVIEALRGSNLVDESDLRMAEGVLALSDRVIADGRASLQDYRQALMLYLLYHRSHLA
ncbi:MAG TPA: hypothetical protein VHR15_10565 [Ktedonobacterales bacterium]|jgi:hypothetical protein|nr:hypothetical protein [Ktedonobacterales bacterium]